MTLSSSGRKALNWTMLLTLLTSVLPLLQQFLPFIQQILSFLPGNKAVLVGASGLAAGSGLYLLSNVARKVFTSRDVEVDADQDAAYLVSAMVKVSSSNSPHKAETLDLLSKALRSYIDCRSADIAVEREKAEDARDKVEDSLRAVVPKLLPVLERLDKRLDNER